MKNIAQNPMRNMHVMQRNEADTVLGSLVNRPAVRAKRTHGTLRPMAARSQRNVGASGPVSHIIESHCMWCNDQREAQPKYLSLVPHPKFFCLFYPQGKFLRHSFETVAPLHHIQFKSFISKVLCVVQRGVQEGATGCNAGETEGLVFTLHHGLKQGPARDCARMVQWCTGSDAHNNVLRRSVG